MLAGLVPCSEYVVRGKKSIFELIEVARADGQDRVAVVSDMKGNPGGISFITLGADEWSWETREIAIKSAKLEKVKIVSGELSFRGDADIAKLFGIEPVDDAEVIMTAVKGEISFSHRDKVVLNIKYSLEVGKHGRIES
jgi:rRNA maturation protein Rpf1